MKITIDKAINGVEKRILPIYDNDADHDALVKAIDTMRKYQKIQEIIDNWENSGEEDDPINIIDNIEEVLEDGKIG